MTRKQDVTVSALIKVVQTTDFFKIHAFIFFHLCRFLVYFLHIVYTLWQGLKKRKLVTQVTRKSLRVTRGPEYAPVRRRRLFTPLNTLVTPLSLEFYQHSIITEINYRMLCFFFIKCIHLQIPRMANLTKEMLGNKQEMAEGTHWTGW